MEYLTHIFMYIYILNKFDFGVLYVCGETIICNYVYFILNSVYIYIYTYKYSIYTLEVVSTVFHNSGSF